MFMGWIVGWAHKMLGLEGIKGFAYRLCGLFAGLFIYCWSHHALADRVRDAQSFFEPESFLVADEGKPNIVVTIKPLALIASELIGDDFNLITLLPPSANPHALAMSIKDRQILADAELVVWLGGRFERFLAKPMAQHTAAKLELGALSALTWPGRPQEDLHIWLEIKNIKVILEALTQQLIRIRPLKAQAIKARLLTALSKLDHTHRQIHMQLAPYSAESFIVSHDGYGHFVNAYGLKQSAAASRLPEEQLSMRKVMMLNRVAGNPRCLIAEPNERAGARLAATLGLPLILADPLGRDDSITDIHGLLLALSQRFEACMQQR